MIATPIYKGYQATCPFCQKTNKVPDTTASPQEFDICDHYFMLADGDRGMSGRQTDMIFKNGIVEK